MEKHKCYKKLDLHQVNGYNVAADYCYEKNDDTFWISNDEYENQVNYCPFCGKKAKVSLNDNKSKLDLEKS